MQEDNFSSFSFDEKGSIEYSICVGGTTLIGAALGGLTGSVLGVIVVGGAGYLYGKKACAFIAPELRKRIWGTTVKLSELEISLALKAIRMGNPKITKKEAINILAESRMGASKNPKLYRDFVT